MNSSNNLLVIGNSFQWVIKDLTTSYNNQFDQIYCFVRYNRITELHNMIPTNFMLKKYLKDNSKGSLIDLSNKPTNIHPIATPVFYLPTPSQYKKLGDKHLKAVEKSIEKNNIKFNLIHSHFVWSSGYVGAKLKEKYDLPFIVTAHGYDIYDLPFRDVEWEEKIKYVLNSADYIITVSNSNLECINKLNVKTPVEVLPNGFKMDLFYPRDSNNCRKYLNLPLDKKIILTVGNLLEVKGHKYLIESMREIIKHRKDVLCIIVGMGPLLNNLEKEIEATGMKAYIRLVGKKAHDEIPIWMNACDIFVLSSLNEGNPTVMFECLGCGKPFVGTNVGGIPEIIKSEDYGLLCESSNSKALAENLLTGLDINWNSEKILEYAKQFTWENISEKTLETYSKICE